MGLDLTWQALQAKDWDDKKLSALQQGWERLDALEGLERALEGERCLGLEYVRMRRESGWHWERVFRSPSGSSIPDVKRVADQGLYGRFFLRTVVNNDLAFQLGHTHARVQQVRLLRADHPWKEVSDSWQQLNARMEERLHSPTRLFYPLSLLATLNSYGAGRTAVRAEMARRLTIAAIALKRYELTHGHPSSSLTALVPGFLSASPRDCMSGQPLRYRANDDGTFRLYSVGEDGKDDGGDPTPVKLDAKGLWEGRDAVWPSPASG